MKTCVTFLILIKLIGGFTVSFGGFNPIGGLLGMASCCFEHYHDQIIENLIFEGTLSLTRCTVNALKLNGMLTAEDSKFDNIEINGSATINKSVITQKTQMKGMLSSDLSKFEDTITINTQIAIFSQSSTRDIYVETSSMDKPQIIKLRHDTNVNGNIHFERNGGIVEKDSSSNVTGEIVNGTLRVVE